MDTLVDPNEALPLSSGHMEVVPPVPPPPRGSLPSIEPDGTQWFQRVIIDEQQQAAGALDDVEVAWEEESDTEPTLVMTRRRLLG